MTIKFGIHVPNGRGQLQFQYLLELAVEAERFGFDSLWVSDHVVRPEIDEVTDRERWMYEPLITLAAIASRTSKISLGTAILLPFRHPVLMAQMLSTLDNASNGRVIVGLGVGSRKAELEALSVNYGARGEIVNEGIESMKTLWTRNKAEYNGKHFQFRDITLEPKPVQKPHPPIYIGGSARKAIARAAKFGDGWLPTDFTVDEYEESLKILESELRTNNRSLKDMIILAHLYTSLHHEAKQARKELEFLCRMTGSDMNKVEKWTIVGTPDEAVKRIEDYLGVGVTHFSFSLPPLSREKDIMKLYAEEVIPRFQSR